MGKRLLLFFWVVSSVCAQAQTILNASMYRFFDQSTTVPYTYSLRLRLSVVSGQGYQFPATLPIYLYRQSDRKLMAQFVATRQVGGQLPNVFGHPCDPTLRVVSDPVYYSIDPVLDPNVYADAGGYFFVNQPLSSRYPTSNLQNAPVVLYHWFSPLFLFDRPDGSGPGKTSTEGFGAFGYGCTGTRANIAIEVGPSLRLSQVDRVSPPPVLEIKFRLTTPLADATGGNRQSATYRPGYSANSLYGVGTWQLGSVTRGNPGQFRTTLEPTTTLQPGAYAVAYVFEQYYNGTKVAESQVESVYTYTQCPKVTPATPFVSEVGQPTQRVQPTICTGQPVQMNGGNGQPKQQYAWLQNDIPIPGATDSVLVVTQPGTYKVRITAPGVCDTFTSANVTIVSKGTAQTATIAGDSLLCDGKLASLSLLPAVSKMQWLRDGQPIANATTDRYVASQPGRYVVRTEDANGCRFQTAPFQVSTGQPVTVTFDSLPPVCLTGSAPVPLRASPAGGQFVGSGVVGNTFDPQRAGVGRHLIEYRPANVAACVQGTRRRTAVVRPDPPLKLTNRLETAPNYPVALGGDLGPGYRYAWTPPTFLSAADQPNPTAAPEESITYRLTVTDSVGCRASDTVRVNVVRRVYIPNTFSPNGDGQNDTWQVRGLGEFPTAVVEVFNRWGQLVFRSAAGYPSPFDGRSETVDLPTGLYTYQIRLQPDLPLQSGTLLLIR